MGEGEGALIPRRLGGHTVSSYQLVAETCVGPLRGAAELITLINFASTLMDPLGELRWAWETDAASLPTVPTAQPPPQPLGPSLAARSARSTASPSALQGPRADGSLCRVQTARTHLGLPHLPLAEQGGGATENGQRFLVTVTGRSWKHVPGDRIALSWP